MTDAMDKVKRANELQAQIQARLMSVPGLGVSPSQTGQAQSG